MTAAPDYVFPIIGCRVWRWGASGLKSLNGVLWHPGRAASAKCVPRVRHESPRLDCRCGVYAAKTFDRLERMGYTEAEGGVRGEVFLWGRVVEHDHGWRAQFAYPRNFVVPISILPPSMSRIQSWLTNLIAYRREIFLLAEEATVPLWLPESGFDPNGTDLILQRCRTSNERRRNERRLKGGDRVAVLGYGIAVVEHADRDLVRAVLGGKDVLIIDRAEVVWDERNARWETSVGARVRSAAVREASGRQWELIQ